MTPRPSPPEHRDAERLARTRTAREHLAPALAVEERVEAVRRLRAPYRRAVLSAAAREAEAA